MSSLEPAEDGGSEKAGAGDGASAMGVGDLEGGVGAGSGGSGLGSSFQEGRGLGREVEVVRLEDGREAFSPSRLRFSTPPVPGTFFAGGSKSLSHPLPFSLLLGSFSLSPLERRQSRRKHDDLNLWRVIPGLASRFGGTGMTGGDRCRRTGSPMRGRVPFESPRCVGT